MVQQDFLVESKSELTEVHQSGTVHLLQNTPNKRYSGQTCNKPISNNEVQLESDYPKVWHKEQGSYQLISGLIEGAGVKVLASGASRCILSLGSSFRPVCGVMALIQLVCDIMS